jgi:hypothetical protein
MDKAETLVPDCERLSLDTDAARTLPVYLAIRGSAVGGYGVFACAEFAKGEWLEQYGGVPSTSEPYDSDEYAVGVKVGRETYYVSALDPNNARSYEPITIVTGVTLAPDEQKPNWTRYVNSVDVKGSPEHNINIETHGGRVYLLARRNIAVGEELLAYYGSFYFSVDTEKLVFRTVDSAAIVYAMQRWDPSYHADLLRMSKLPWLVLEENNNGRRHLLAIVAYDRSAFDALRIWNVVSLRTVPDEARVFHELVRFTLEYARAERYSRVEVVDARFFGVRESVRARNATEFDANRVRVMSNYIVEPIEWRNAGELVQRFMEDCVERGNVRRARFDLIAAMLQPPQTIATSTYVIRDPGGPAHRNAALFVIEHRPDFEFVSLVCFEDSVLSRPEQSPYSVVVVRMLVQTIVAALERIAKHPLRIALDYGQAIHDLFEAGGYVKKELRKNAKSLYYAPDVVYERAVSL